VKNEKAILCAREGFVDELEDFFNESNNQSKYLNKAEKYDILRDKFDEHLNILLELKGFWERKEKGRG